MQVVAQRIRIVYSSYELSLFDSYLPFVDVSEPYVFRAIEKRVDSSEE